MRDTNPQKTDRRTGEVQAGNCKAKVLEAVKTVSSKWPLFVAWCKATVSKLYIRFFPLEDCFEKYEREMSARRIRALTNLNNDSWESFVGLLNGQLAKVQDSQFFKGRYRVKAVDLEEEFEKILKSHLEGKSTPFLSSIKGNSLKSIMIYEITSPVFGVGKFEYHSGENESQGLYTLEGGALAFSQTVTGGLFVHFAYPKSEGLFKNKESGLIYRLFDDISKVTEGDLDKAFRFFFRFNNEMSLYGRPSLWGRVILWWTKKKNAGTKWNALLPLLSEAAMNMLKKIVS